LADNSHFCHIRQVCRVTRGREYAQVKGQLDQRRNGMNLSSHLTELKRKHQHLSTEVEQAQRALGMDGLHVADLKKQKLRLKEEIRRLSV
jgi:hypothetical protein